MAATVNKLAQDMLGPKAGVLVKELSAIAGGKAAASRTLQWPV